MRVETSKIIDRILEEKFPSKRRKNHRIKDRKLRISLLKRKSFKKNRKEFTVENLKTNFEPYNPISLAFIGNYKMKVVPNQNLLNSSVKKDEDDN